MAHALHDITVTTRIDEASPALKGVLGIPSGTGPWPAVVVVHEAFGVDDEMRKQVAHLADLGYLALMPDLFTAGGVRRCIGATFRSLRSGTGRAFADIEAARQLLLARDDSNGAVGVIGFCMGGGFALLAAARGYDGGATGFAAASVNYGIMPKDLGLIEHSCPVVASYGAQDFSLRGAAAKLEKTYTTNGVAHDVKEYPGAAHAFLNELPTGPGWMRPMLRITGFGPRPDVAVDAWKRITAFFDEHLVAPAPTKPAKGSAPA
ncbi:MAG: dienelactone hydrolase family protein [Rhodoglobus sp.]